MIKPDKNFKMSRASKTMIALMCKNNEERHSLRQMLVQSQLAGAAARRAAFKSKSKGKDQE